MIELITDWHALTRVTPRALFGYFAARGWGVDVRGPLPTRFRHACTPATLIKILAWVEGRDEVEVWREVITGGADFELIGGRLG